MLNSEAGTHEHENLGCPVNDVGGLRGFHPEHLADLAKSGVNAETILELGIHTVPPRWIRKHLGFDNPDIESLLCFPYPGVDGFCRDKVFPSLKGENGHTTRYLQRKGSGVHLYIPPLARAALTDPSVTLYVTEGEKKAAKACQEGFPCIGLGGLWNWVSGGNPIPDLDLVICQERRLMLVPDSDVWQGRDDLLHAVYALGAELEWRGAYVRVLRIPEEVIE
jgi:hypothetical protein